ncbi:DM13 domain-containing protein [Leptolyngbya sp. AN03gr2]|uniref:DM13 domain-containing protein n=1 Tax=unclassified Leptolyngbya TaxID=2650499 RepID=UPI003D30F6F6
MKRRFRYVLLSCLVAIVIASCGGKATTQTPSPVPQSTAIASPTTPQAATAKSSVISSGNFVNGEHPTQGTAEIVNQNGKRILQLNDQFKTSTSGPDLVVVLHRSANVIGETTPPAYPLKEGDYTVLAPLRAFSGAQSYEIPDNLNLNDFQSAVIWCRRFNATFGSAALKSSS